MGYGYDYEKMGLHFDTKELELEPEEAKEDNFDVDRALEGIKKTRTQKGDIWQLGDHFLMCGDSTSAEHPTMKPIPLMGRFIRNSSRRGGQVIDLFGGSGSTLMACEQLGRHCRAMEYDPKYCDVIITRWEKYTGRKATKID